MVRMTAREEPVSMPLSLPVCGSGWPRMPVRGVIGRGQTRGQSSHGVVTEGEGTVVCLWLSLHCLNVYSLYLGVHIP